MERHQQLVSLTQRLLVAEAGADWAALGVIDSELSEALPRLAAHGVWVGDERVAFDGLRQAHRRLRACCERETARLAGQLGEMRAHKEGWMAYAIDEQTPGVAP